MADMNKARNIAGATHAKEGARKKNKKWNEDRNKKLNAEWNADRNKIWNSDRNKKWRERRNLALLRDHLEKLNGPRRDGAKNENQVRKGRKRAAQVRKLGGT